MDEDLALAINGLLDARDFLGFQLAYAQEQMTHQDFNVIAERYLKHEKLDPERLVRATRKLVELIGTRVDIDVVMAAFKVSIDDASAALSRVARELAS